MPSRNTTRFDVDNSFYHVYARGASKQRIFYDDADFKFFISLFARYLSDSPTPRKQGEDYPHLHNDIELLAYCLMSNHFHMYIHQINAGSLSMLMRGIMTSYSRYFNRKYKRTGSLYESRYKSNRITDDAYNIHISRYIHMNPRYWHYYKYSSINFYLDNREVTWLNKYEVLKEFNSPNEYLKFLNDYQTNKSQIENIKACLVDY